MLLSAGLIPAFRARFWNIGLNGCMLMGAVGATGVALYVPTGTSELTGLLMFVGAVVCGAVWALIPGLLRLQFQTPEIIVSLLLNYVAQRIVDFLVFSAWKNPAGRGFPGTANFEQSLWLSRWDVTKLVLPSWLPLPDGWGPPLQVWMRGLGNSNIHTGLAVAVIGVIAIWLMMNRTIWGLRIDIAGQGARASRYLGLSTGWVIVLVSVIGGGFAGIAGWSEVAGLNHRLEAGISQELGYTAILVVALGALRPGLTAGASVIVAGLLIGGSQLQVQFSLPVAMAGVLLWAILASLSAFLAVVVSSGAVLLPATLGAIVTELSGATNLGVEGIMLFGAMVAYGTAFTTGDAVLGVIAGSLAGGLLSLTHAIPVVYGRMSQERQLVLGLILVYLGDALSRLLGTPYISKASKARPTHWPLS
ncbi:MAG: hypothetical protein EBT22_06385 [Chloroflexi bacterium]|nr:hypothetical protein [Chloroflexota bacterium]